MTVSVEHVFSMGDKASMDSIDDVAHVAVW